MATPAETGERLLSIGDLAEGSGISTDTLRVWERRYGRPVPVRLPSGHRRYRVTDLSWLRRVAEALSRGHRPSAVLHLPEDALDALLAPAPEPPREEAFLARSLALARAYRVGDLRRALFAEARRLGPRDFLHRRAGPLVAVCGREWADGSLTIRHEHLLTSALEDVLRALRLEVPARTHGPLVLLATLPGEMHGLGLLMAALAAALSGARPRLIGTSLPLPEIAAAAHESGAALVAVSVSLATGGVETDRMLKTLRALLPQGVRLVAGGAGARRRRGGPRGVEFLPDLPAFEDLLAGAAGPG